MIKIEQDQLEDVKFQNYSLFSRKNLVLKPSTKADQDHVPEVNKESQNYVDFSLTTKTYLNIQKKLTYNTLRVGVPLIT